MNSAEFDDRSRRFFGSPGYREKGSLGFSQEETDDAWLAAAYKDYDAGEHEALWTALKVVMDSRLPLPEWVYQAVIQRLNEGESDREKAVRHQRVQARARAGYVLEHVQRDKTLTEARQAAREDLSQFGMDKSDETLR